MYVFFDQTATSGSNMADLSSFTSTKVTGCGQRSGTGGGQTFWAEVGPLTTLTTVISRGSLYRQINAVEKNKFYICALNRLVFFRIGVRTQCALIIILSFKFIKMKQKPFTSQHWLWNLYLHALLQNNQTQVLMK